MNILALLFDPRNNISRKWFIIGMLISVGVCLLLSFIPFYMFRTHFITNPSAIAGSANPQDLNQIVKALQTPTGEFPPILVFATFLYFLDSLLIFYTAFCLELKRLRDIGVSAWWILAVIIFATFLKFINLSLATELIWLAFIMLLAIIPSNMIRAKT